jgi:hypothetical protein
VRLRRGTGLLRRTANLPAGLETLKLGFWSKGYSFEGSEHANVLVNGTIVFTLTSAQADNTYRYSEIDLSSFLSAGQIEVTLDANMGNIEDEWHVDDIRLIGTSMPVPPVANAGPDQTVIDSDNDGEQTVTLNGGASLDPDGGVIVAYEWKEGVIVLGTGVSLTTSLSVGVHTITLTVTDDEGAMASDTVQITVNAPPLEVFNDSFEDGSLSPWTQDSQNDWFVSNSPVFDGALSAKVDGSASDAQLISPLIDLQGRTAATITFAWFIGSSLDKGEYLACDTSTDGGSTWSEVARLSGKNGVNAPEGAWQSAAFEVSSAVGSLRLRFRGKMNSTDEFANVDAVRVVVH